MYVCCEIKKMSNCGNFNFYRLCLWEQGFSVWKRGDADVKWRLCILNLSYQYAIYKYSTDIFSYSPEFKQFCPLERLRNNDNEHSRLWSSKPFPTKKQFLEKWLITDLGQEGYNLNLEHLGISENKKVVKWKDLYRNK